MICRQRPSSRQLIWWCSRMKGFAGDTHGVISWSIYYTAFSRPKSITPVSPNLLRTCKFRPIRWQYCTRKILQCLPLCMQNLGIRRRSCVQLIAEKTISSTRKRLFHLERFVKTFRKVLEKSEPEEDRFSTFVHRPLVMRCRWVNTHSYARIFAFGNFVQ